ncbi:hypothetical protein GQ43DRAFT_472889 [Delitschia confertaspora ATCC 74209]|uniref:Uncharacterized protein n=1 Tax=Delitschia confertaspora ATCC 74209 TaxID=1513339 RepID=A0A9P4JJF2_9PLEO|nr:hypothetical protein GQ43DRAFT_472889 [Delitschia confertaspora ATCC 74209]
MTDRDCGQNSHSDDRYAYDMNSDIGRWQRSPREFDPSWSPHYYNPPETQQYRRVPKTKTSPVLTRTRVVRHGTQPAPAPSPPLPPRPTSSDNTAALAYRHQPPPRRAESYSQKTQKTPLESFRSTRVWPPPGCRPGDQLSAKDAEDIICAGASTFTGYSDKIQNAPPDHNRFYAVMDSESNCRTDRAPFQQSAYCDISLNLTKPTESPFPWIALDQPCMAYAFGRSPGTTTLNYWVGKHGSSYTPLKFGANVKPRKLKLLQILERLAHLEKEGLELDDPEELYDYLYNTLIEDPERYSNPHFGLHQQMTDLITVLTSDRWIDFTNPKNQVVAKYFDSSSLNKKQDFFHQLLLSVELYLRIHSPGHEEKPKRKLLLALPPIVAWDLAVAQRWLENMSITKAKTSSRQSTFSFELKSKERQKEALRVFAGTLKWPNMDEIEYVLEEKDKKEKPPEDRSADAMSWFSGIVLPGRTLPWLVMNSLIDCDRDTGESLGYLTHIHPAAGFQYRASTYWSHECIVGKVLSAARGVTQIAGWIGPCIYTPDLKRTECVRVRQKEPLGFKLTPKDVESMDVRSHPLGPRETSYPIDDYEIPMPETEDVTDLIRVEKLSFVPTKEQPSSSRLGPGAPLLFDAAILFACGGDSWPMKLKYNVDFISAFPCHNGPHLLFYDFAYKPIKVDDSLVDIKDWGQQSGYISHTTSSIGSDSRDSMVLSRTTEQPQLAHMQIKKVLAIEALGVSDNEVFARAWCAHHGHSAIIANIKDTCMACAIREAYAACISVVIFTEGGKREEKDE